MNESPIRILLVEDNAGDARLLSEYLKEVRNEAFHLERVETLRDAIYRLRHGGLDVVLLDLSLPDSAGLDTVRDLYSAHPQVPIVVLTGTDDETQAVQAVKEGAQDYLVKGKGDGDLLIRATRYAIERHRMLRELEHARQLEHYVATHDLLTGLPNRQLFQDRLAQSIAEARRTGTLVGLMFLDLDRFKSANDTLGHAVGDRLLRAVARRLSQCIRESDTAARIGGDEFTIVLTNLRRPQDAAKVARKVLAEVARGFAYDGRELFTTASIGISLFPLDGEEAEELLKNADAAMYRAKEGGKNNFQFYKPSMNAKAAERLDLENALRHALEREELELYYQPQFHARTGKILAMEALVRWRHPRLGLLLPRSFVPLAQDVGLIVPLGDWVLREAAWQARRWMDRGLDPVRVAVNFSGYQFLRENPLRTIVRVLAETRLPPELLELELTESGLMGDVDAVVQILHQLRDVGVHLSMDDFGTGYSSLSQIKRFPLEKLKIDKQFVQAFTHNPQDRAITSTIISLAQGLALTPIAEGVETQEQVDALLRLGCDTMQGYVFSRPVSQRVAMRLLTTGYIPNALRLGMPTSI